MGESVENEKVQAPLPEAFRCARTEGSFPPLANSGAMSLWTTPQMIAGGCGFVRDLCLRLNNGEVCGPNCLPFSLGGRTPLLLTEGKPDPRPVFRGMLSTLSQMAGWSSYRGGLGASVDGQIHPIRTEVGGGRYVAFTTTSRPQSSLFSLWELVRAPEGQDIYIGARTAPSVVISRAVTGRGQAGRLLPWGEPDSAPRPLGLIPVVEE